MSAWPTQNTFKTIDQRPAKSNINVPSTWPWDWISVISFLIGGMMHVSFNIGGQFFAGELIALALLPLLLFDRFYFHRQVIKSQQWLWRFTTVLLLGLLLTSIGYVLSDYYRNNPTSDYLR